MRSERSYLSNLFDCFAEAEGVAYPDISDLFEGRRGQTSFEKDGGLESSLIQELESDDFWSMKSDCGDCGAQGEVSAPLIEEQGAQAVFNERGITGYRKAKKVTEGQILQWAKDTRDYWIVTGCTDRTKPYPSNSDNEVHTHNLQTGYFEIVPGESWRDLDQDLYLGRRGLRGGLSLQAFLDRNMLSNQLLSDFKILEWMKHTYNYWVEISHEKSGKYPSGTKKPENNIVYTFDGKLDVYEVVLGENWNGINIALHLGLRGLPGGSSLALLRKRFGLDDYDSRSRAYGSAWNKAKLRKEKGSCGLKQIKVPKI